MKLVLTVRPSARAVREGVKFSRKPDCWITGFLEKARNALRCAGPALACPVALRRDSEQKSQHEQRDTEGASPCSREDDTGDEIEREGEADDQQDARSGQGLLTLVVQAKPPHVREKCQQAGFLACQLYRKLVFWFEGARTWHATRKSYQTPSRPGSVCHVVSEMRPAR